MRQMLLLLSLVVVGCSWLPWPPKPTPTPTPPPPAWECPLEMPECGAVGQTCSTPESPCWHNPTTNPEHCEEAPACPPPPPACPEECPEGQHCVDPNVGCVPEPVDPEPEPDCGFPQGAPNSDFTSTENPGTFGSVVNSVMADMTGCAVGTDCPITFGPDPWMAMVCERLCEAGLNCGRHNNTPPGATDQISVKRGSFCDGLLHENYQVYNYGGAKVRWAPGGTQDGWILDPNSSVCQQEPPPPSGDCPLPHPDVTSMKFKTKEAGNHLDTTWTTVSQEPFCREIGLSPMADGTPRAGCPVRPECGSSDPPDAICHDRAACEAELCDQKWECNGEPYPGWRGNPAQTDCSGHWKTYCANAPTVAEGNR